MGTSKTEFETEYILGEIYEKLFERANTALPEFGFKRTFNGWKATKGRLNGTNAKGHVFMYPDKPSTLFDHKSNGHTAVWNYIKSKTGHSEDNDIFNELAKLADYELPKELSKSKKHTDDTSNNSDLLELCFSYFKKQLFKDSGKATLRYLTSRGYNKKEIKNMDFGYQSGKRDLEKFLLKKYDAEKVESFLDKKEGLFPYDYKDHKVVYAYRDRQGKITGLWGRTLKEDKKMYLPLTSPAPKTEFFNIHKKVKDSGEIIVAEGHFDAMIAAERGVNNFVAIGGKEIRDSHIKAAIKQGITKIILAPDWDDEGIKATEKNIEYVIEHNLKVSLVTLPKGFKDPDELIADKGIQALQNAINTKKSAISWLARRKINSHDLNKEDEKEKYIESCKKILGNLKSEKQKDTFLEVLKKRKIEDEIYLELKAVKPKLSLEEIFDKLIRPTKEFLKVDLPERKRIIDPWVYEGDLIMVSSDPGVGKTFLCTEIVRGIQQGGNLLGGLWECVRPTQTFYIDGEMHYDDTKRMLKFAGIEKAFVLSKMEWKQREYQPPLDLNEETIRDFIYEKIIKLGVKFVVLDNIYSLWHNLDLNEAKEWSVTNQWLMKLRSQGVSVLIAHHTNKAGDQIDTKTKLNNLNTAFTLVKNSKPPTDDEDNELCSFSIKIDKKRVKAPSLKDIVLTCEDGKWRTSKGDKVIERKKKESMADKVTLLLLDGKKQEEIMKLMDISQGHVSK